jgi:hypothetical protein
MINRPHCITISFVSVDPGRSVLGCELMRHLLHTVGCILQPQPVADRIKKFLFGRSMPASQYNNYQACV